MAAHQGPLRHEPTAPHAPGREQQVTGSARAHQLDQAGDGRAIINDAVPYSRDGEARARAGQPDVAGQSQIVAAPDTQAVDHGDGQRQGWGTRFSNSGAKLSKSGTQFVSNSGTQFVSNSLLPMQGEERPAALGVGRSGAAGTEDRSSLEAARGSRTFGAL